MRFVVIFLCVCLLWAPSRSCHVLVKGISTVLRENIVYSKREMRQCLNHIIHCPHWHRNCKENAHHQRVLLQPESIDFLVKSGLYSELMELGIRGPSYANPIERTDKVPSYCGPPQGPPPA